MLQFYMSSETVLTQESVVMPALERLLNGFDLSAAAMKGRFLPVTVTVI